MQGRVRLQPEVRSQGNPKVPATTNRLEGWFGRFKPQARLTRGLKTEGRGPSTSCA